MLNRQNLHIGTSGWSYKHWAEIFYPADIKPAGYLEYYASKFSCVELNSSFYHLPQISTVSGWTERTPPDFRFCAKLSRYITHQLRLIHCEEALLKYFSVMEGMRSKLGPVLVQLHPGLKFNRSLADDFMTLLTKHYHHYRFALEVRNRSWITDDAFELLSRHRIAFVIADSGKRYPYHEAVTTDFVYLRFHGHEQLYASDYADEELTQYTDKIASWLDNEKEVWVFFNNDYHGFAVKNAAKLQQIIHTV